MRQAGPQALRPRGARAVTSVALAAGLTVGAVACSSKPSRSDLQHALSGRYGLSNEQASCVAKGLFSHFSSSDLKRIRDASEIVALPAGLEVRLSKELQSLERSCGAASVSS